MSPDCVFLGVPTVADDRRDKGQRLDPAVQSRITLFTLYGALQTRRDETRAVKWLTKSFHMHSIFFGLRQYCSACHQWHFSPRNVLCVFQASTEKTISARSQKE